MSCGLGAVILVLILLKVQPEEVPVDLEALQADLEELQRQEEQLQTTLDKKTQEKANLNSQASSLNSQLSQVDQQIMDVSQSTANKKAEVEGLKDKIEKTPIAKTQDVIEDKNVGEENYLLGLKVEGKRIVFLIDMSASMTDEKLINIILRKSGTDAEKKKGPKWQRTVRIARWLSNRIPKQSKAVVIGFNNKTTSVGPNGWFQGADTGAISKVFASLDTLVPENATNLQNALQSAKKLSPAPTNYYIVTDGLPTAGTSNYRSLNPFSSCSSLIGTSSKISGECRVKLFRQSVQESGPRGGQPVNIILLPLEGDPEAAPEFWGWTYTTGGLLISPAVSWP
ncbi:hypothetical protein A9Q83_16555 [Alphaproteobacteria bacterium 46_93_T64]|nr:hypothetical protein A9Q83_16555 [Alphaproteobacteria bacterium 46_93_T64]